MVAKQGGEEEEEGRDSSPSRLGFGSCHLLAVLVPLLRSRDQAGEGVGCAQGRKCFSFKTAVKEQRDSEKEEEPQDLHPQRSAPVPEKGRG